jgi:hypothetical protein
MISKKFLYISAVVIMLAMVIISACGGGSSSSKLSDNNADLSGVTLSQGVLSPAFNPNTISYAAEVQYNVASITVTPSAAGVNAGITVNGRTSRPERLQPTLPSVPARI